MKLINSKPEKAILSAVKKYIEYVSPTYGPAGKKVLIVQNEFNHEAVDDGKRASEAFEIEDEFENAIVQFIKETTQKGKDGTTTAAIIMSNIILEALKDLDNELLIKPDYFALSQELSKGLEEAIKQLQKASRKIKTQEELEAIAYNSYNDRPIAKMIAETILKIGKDGVLTIEDSKGTETTTEVVNGLEIQKGYQSPYFINQDDRVVLQDPNILIVAKKVNLFAEIAPLLQKIMPEGNRAFVLVAEDFGDDVINKSIAFKAMGQLMPLLVQAPGFADKRDEMWDLAAVVGAKVVDDRVLKLTDVNKEHLGSCELVKSEKNKTTFIGGAGKVRDYVESMKSQLEKSESKFEIDTLNRRIAQINGGIALIKVGAYTENEQKGIKTKVENAVNSTQIAYKGGVVKGAAQALLDIKTSSELLNRALKAPRKQLEENGAKYLDENALDPTEVLTTAIETAVSIARGLLTMGGISVPKREKPKRIDY